ncbi:MAG TPA: carbohydrate kinase family protein [Gemmataceae bacterium]|nr:carbohydrate kinase family protein [Gemmataceae bacterium]
MTEVLCAGIIVADHVCTPIDHLPVAGELVMADGMLLTIGGCAANTAVDLAKMEVGVAISGRIGGDVFGRVVGDILRDSGVDASNLAVSADADTSQTLIVNVKGQDRRFIHTFGANRAFKAADIPVALFDQIKILYFGGYLTMPGVTQDDLAAVFAKARAKGVKTVLDVVVQGKEVSLAQFERLLPHTDVFLPNNDEAERITGASDPVKQAEIFHQAGARTCVITMGGSGSILVHKGVKLRAGAFQVPFVDASGGGDAFDAGFIYGLLRGMDPEGCLRVASALGASCVRAIGTTPGVFTRAECEAFLRQQSLTIERI